MASDDLFFDPWGDFARAEQAPQPPEAESESSAPPRWAPPPRRSFPATRPAPRPVRPEPPAIDPVGLPGPALRAAEVPGAGVLRECVLPELYRLAERLRSQRHGVLVDDRSGQDRPSVRLQLRPRPGPFDPPGSTYPVLEFVAAGEGEVLLVRTWMNPTDTDPASERQVTLGNPAPRVRRLAVDFAEMVFARY